MAGSEGTRSRCEPVHSESRGSGCEFLKIAWTSGSLSVLPMMVLYISGFTVLGPYLPDLMTNFFAEQRSGAAINCEDFTGKLPQECIQGSAASVMWSSYSTFFSHAIIAFMLYPLTGVWSDMMGRKPFLLLAQTLAILPYFIILFHVTVGMSLYLYYPILMLGDVVSLMSAALAMVSDCLPAEHKAAGFAVTMGSIAVGLVIAPVAGQMLGLKGAVAAAIGLKGAGLLYTMVLIKETVPQEVQAAARQKSAQFWHQQQQSTQQTSSEDNLFIRTWHAACHLIGNQPAIRTMVQGFLIVLRNSEFIRLTAAQMGATFVSAGLMQVENQYLLVVFGFQQHEFAMVMVIFGLGMFLAQVVLMPLLLLVMRERALIVTGFLGVFLKLVGLAVAKTKAQVLVSITFGTLYFMAYPAISGIKANAVPAHEQGAVQGALSGATALASGIGPLVFNQLWRWATITVYMPWVVPATCAVISLMPLALVCGLDLDKLRRWKLQQETLQADTCSVDEPLLAESHEPTQHKLEQSAAPIGVSEKDGDCLDGSALHRAGSSSRVDT